MKSKSKNTSKIIFSILILIVMGSLAREAASYRPLDGIGFFFYSLQGSLPALFLYWFFRMRGKIHLSEPQGFKKKLNRFTFPGVIMGALVYFILVIANGIFDMGPESLHEARVLGTSPGGRRSHYSAQVTSWRKEGTTEKITIRGWEYQKINSHFTASPKYTSMRVKTKPGRLGFEWVVEYQLLT